MLNCLYGHMVRLSRSASLAFVLTGVVTAAPALLPPDFSFVGIAHADDDDDGGDSSSGGGNSSDNGDSNRSRKHNSKHLRGPKNLMDYLEKRRQVQAAPVRKSRAVQKRKQTAKPVVVAEPAYEPSRLVALGLDAAAIEQLQERGFSVADRSPSNLTGTELVRLQIPPRMTLETARREVSELAPTAEVDFNHYYRPEQETVTPEPTNTPPANKSACNGTDCTLMRHLIGWEQPQQTDNVCAVFPRIGLIDTAVNPEHEALKDAKIDIIRLSDGQLPQSGTQHGTAVAALLVGAENSRAPGLLPQAELVAVDVFHGTQNDTSRATTYDLVRAIDLLADKQIPLINMSLSGPDNRLLRKAVEAAMQRRIVLVAAAGNEGPHAKPVYPAAYAGVIAVTAVDRDGNPYRRAVRGEHIDLAAPGVGVWTAASVSGARQKTGTSFAAPFVTAAAAKLKAQQPEMDHQQITQELTKQAKDMGKPGHDPVYGWGLLNAQALCSS